MARPRFNDRFSHVPLFVWVLVELMRDRKDSRPRDTVRAASKRLQTKLAQDFEGGRVLPTETIRRYYKNFKSTARRSNNGKQLAQALLAISRERREFLGWDVRPWQWVIDPEFFIALGGRCSQPEGL